MKVIKDVKPRWNKVLGSIDEAVELHKECVEKGDYKFIYEDIDETRTRNKGNVSQP